MKKKLLYLLLPFVIACGNSTQSTIAPVSGKTEKTTMGNTNNSIHQFKVKDIDGNDFDFATLKGKKVMIVNTASECGLTPQYEQLEAVYKKYGAAKFTIIGFPANNFGSQEPGSNAEIKGFCTKNYGVTFPMMAKVSVKGKDQAAIYHWLCTKSENGVSDHDVTWNFQKFLIDEEGKLVKSVSPRVLPDDKSITDWIQQ